MAKVLDCISVSKKFLTEVREEIEQTKRTPRVKIFLATEDPGCASYSRAIATMFDDVGIKPLLVRTNPSELEERIRSTEHEQEITGCLVMYPINAQERHDRDFMRIVPQFKDVEGLGAQNVFRLLHYQQTFEGTPCKAVVPCTPKAVIKLLTEHDIDIEGNDVVILNRSYQVGIPLERMFNNLKATVTTCDIHTKRDSVRHYLSRADIVVTAVPGEIELFDETQIKPGATVIDCSFGGNFDPARIERVAENISYRQGRNYIGRVTTAMAALNTLYLLRYQLFLEGRDLH